MIRIVFVRHAETVWHAEDRYAGSSDIGLSVTGQRQAAAFAHWAKSADIARLYVSPMVRAIATARPVAEALSLTPIVDPRLRELDFGSGEGLTPAEMATRMPEEYRAFLQDPVRHHFPGGENPREVIVRVRAAIQDIIRDAAELPATSSKRILIVFHRTLIRLFLCDALGISLSLYRQVFPQLGSVALTELEFTPQQTPASSTVSLLRFNVPLANVMD